mgnify:CR=1 FL=1
MKESIEQMAAEELARANQTFPMFASWHEAYAVLLEEVEEAKDEIKAMETLTRFYWNAVRGKHINDDTRRYHVERIRDTAIKVVEELIQVIAMCDKTFKSMDGEQNEEHSTGMKNFKGVII